MSTARARGTAPGRSPGDRVSVRATVTGGGVDRLVLHGAGGAVLAAADGAESTADVPVTAGTWLAAAAYGGDDEHTLGAPAFARTSPVCVDVAGRREEQRGARRAVVERARGVHRAVAGDPDP